MLKPTEICVYAQIQRALPVLVAAVLMLLSITAQAQFFSNKKPDLLRAEEAFMVTASVDNNQLRVNWSIANDYYMYRDQFAILADSSNVTIGAIQYPDGEIEDDPEFGEVEVYFHYAELIAPLSGPAGSVQLTLKGQGCNKPVGICYPPITRTLNVSLGEPVADDRNTVDQSTPVTPSPAAPTQKSFFNYLLAAFGAGILLSFTPCVLPMIPILAGVIARQHKPGKLRSGWLACCYVAGTVVTYMIAGWVAGATGAQLQAYFQNPWVIGFICLLLLLLAASLFGWFKIELPASLQTRLNSIEVNTGSAAISSFSLGLISALVVGACVSPILIVTLGAAITQGDPVLGMGIMGAMAIGMGLLLILFGFGAGWLLPRTGAWMQQIQVVFGFMVIGVAIYLASALSAVPALLLWSLLLLIAGFYFWHLANPVASALGRSALRTTGFVSLLWGAMALVGAATGGADILRPLDSIRLGNGAGQSERSDLPFQTVTTLSAAKQLLEQAKNQRRPALIDFYADWCLDCKRMHRTTFRQASVVNALQSWSLIEIDVTDTSAESEEVKRFFDVFGPPATLFIDPGGEELSAMRQYGYLDESEFMALLDKASDAMRGQVE